MKQGLGILIETLFCGCCVTPVLLFSLRCVVSLARALHAIAGYSRCATVQVWGWCRVDYWVGWRASIGKDSAIAVYGAEPTLFHLVWSGLAWPGLAWSDRY